MHDNLKTTIANELMLARMKIHRLEVENKALREQLGRFPHEVLFMAFGVGILTGMVVSAMIFK